MNVILVDTSSWISYFDGKGHADLDMALEEGRVILSPVVAAELLSGHMTRKQRLLLIELLQDLPLCDLSLAHWVRVGKGRSELLSKGLSVSTPDAHIAQSCLDINCFLLTEDEVFSKIALYYPLRLL